MQPVSKHLGIYVKNSNIYLYIAIVKESHLNTLEISFVQENWVFFIKAPCNCSSLLLHMLNYAHHHYNVKR